MSKAVLVIDMPESCDKCPLMFRHEEERCCMPEGRNSFSNKPSWCPLKPLPSIDEYAFGAWDEGYRACLENILGET